MTPHDSASEGLGFRASVHEALKLSPKGIGLLSAPAEFFGTMLDLCEDCAELTVLKRTYNSRLLTYFVDAVEKGTPEALVDAVGRASTYLTEEELTNRQVSRSVCEQLAGGIADYLRIPLQDEWPEEQGAAEQPYVGQGYVAGSGGSGATASGWANDGSVTAGGPADGGRRSRISPTVLTGVVIAAILAIGAFAFMGFRSSDGLTHEVPDLVGLTQKQAKSVIAESDYFELGEVKRTYSSDVDKNDVISQSPEAGTTASQSRTIDLVVSRGEKSDDEGAEGGFESKAGNVLEQANMDLLGGTLYYRLYTSSHAAELVAREGATGSSYTVYSINESEATHGIYNVLAVGKRIYFGIGMDYDADEHYDYGTICSIATDGSDFRELAYQDAYDSFMKFYIMDGRIYYYHGGYICSSSVDGGDEREEILVEGDAQFFCHQGSLYLAEKDHTTFVRAQDGSRVHAYSVAQWDDFTVSDDYLITLTHVAEGHVLHWYDLSSGEETTQVTMPFPGTETKGINCSGNDAIVIMESGSASKSCAIYTVTQGGLVDMLWQGSGYSLVWRPTVLGDRVYFTVVANEWSRDTPCSIALSGGDFRVEDTMLDHSEI